jgi:hypothetical protein
MLGEQRADMADGQLVDATGLGGSLRSWP